MLDLIAYYVLQNHSDDALRQEVVTLQEEKLVYETTAKVCLFFFLLKPGAWVAQ